MHLSCPVMTSPSIELHSISLFPHVCLSYSVELTVKCDMSFDGLDNSATSSSTSRTVHWLTPVQTPWETSPRFHVTFVPLPATILSQVNLTPSMLPSTSSCQPSSPHELKAMPEAKRKKQEAFRELLNETC